MKRNQTFEVTDLLTGRLTELETEPYNLPEHIIQKLSKDNVFKAPGLVDLQVNGYKGIDLNCRSLSEEDVHSMVIELLKAGVTAFLPTLITNDPGIIERNLAVIDHAIDQFPLVKECIPGVHLEGPFLSGEEGARGAHPLKWIRNPDPGLLDQWNDASGNRIKLITISPELPSVGSFIKDCSQRNIHVALGHTMASREEIQASVSAGATLSTHLGNGIPQNIHRHHNPMFAQLGADALFVSVIADGHHLSEDLLKIIMRTKGEKTLLVSDATAFAGMDPGTYEAPIGGKVVLDTDKRLSMYEQPGYLAGSASSLLDCVNYLSGSKHCSLDHAWKMASLIPMKYLCGKSEISPANQHGMVIFTLAEEQVKILTTMKGRIAF